MSAASDAFRVRQGLIDLNVLSRRELFALWQSFEGLSPAATRDALAATLPGLADKYGSAAATLAADWYDDLRDAAGAKGRFIATPAALPDQARYESLAGWGTDPLFRATPDPVAARSLVAGGLQRVVSNAHRHTVMGASTRDPAAVGWKRLAAGGCSFCIMIANRNVTFTEATADFGAHDDCKCTAYPLIKGAEPIDVKKYVPTEKNVTDADRKRVRDWLKDHPQHTN